ncbi:AI-2E family transporter [Armatimonas sp.]|uniref:AI-2E family transporter n=1 Tax=Armatimonas sp. TaxID=1872638 RepID=UPI0037530083
MARREAFLSGLFGALGVALAALGLFLGYRFLLAATAVSTPFVAALVIALLCDPLVNKFQKQVRFTKGKRAPAVALVFVLFLLSFTALVVLVVPSLIEQIGKLVEWFTPTDPGTPPPPAPSASPPPSNALPSPSPSPAPALQSGFDVAQQSVNTWLRSHQKLGPVRLPRSIDSLVQQYSGQMTMAAKQVGPKLLSAVVGSFSGLLNVILIPLLTFFLLMDLGRLRRRLIFLLPTKLRTHFVGVASDVGEVFSNYLRGMMQVSLAYMTTATLLFALLCLILAPQMLGYILLIGIVSGALYIVPYVGFLGAAATSVIVALVTGAGSPAVIASVVLLAMLNFTFDNVITPRIVGSGVGVHPIVAMFALLVGASLFGLWGMLLAYPAAGSIQVVLFRLFPKLAQPTPETTQAAVEDTGETPSEAPVSSEGQ